MKFASKLTPEEVSTLNQLLKYGPCYRYRQRAHMILLSNKDYMLNELADIFQINRDQVSEIISRWESDGLVGLRDLPGKGRKAKISTETAKIIIRWVDDNVPRSTKEIMHYASEKLHLDVCEDTIKNLLKSAGYSWKRLRKSIKHLRNQSAFDETQLEIAELKAKHDRGDIDLQYFDASGFSLIPTVPYAWQKKGSAKNGCLHHVVEE